MDRVKAAALLDELLLDQTSHETVEQDKRTDLRSITPE